MVQAGKTVIVVDDIEQSRQVIVGLYEELGWTVIGQAANGQDALELIEKQKPQLVSLDVIMPVMDGIEAYQRIISKGFIAATRVVFISYLAKEHDALQAISEKVRPDLFLAKFPTAMQLKEKLGQIFGVEDQTLHLADEAKPEQKTQEWLDDLSAKMYDTAS